MSESLDPQTFDIDAWLTGAKLPEHSVKVYGRADLLAKADELGRQISAAEQDEAAEYALGDRTSAASLRAEYEKLAEEYEASALTIRVRAITEAEDAELNELVKAEKLTDEDKAIHQIAIASVEPRLTVETVQRMRMVLGPRQVLNIWHAVMRATNEIPEVSPRFLPKRSGQDTGRE
jgi:hypothetical protein